MFLITTSLKKGKSTQGLFYYLCPCCCLLVLQSQSCIINCQGASGGHSPPTCWTCCLFSNVHFIKDDDGNITDKR